MKCPIMFKSVEAFTPKIKAVHAMETRVEPMLPEVMPRLILREASIPVRCLDRVNIGTVVRSGMLDKKERPRFRTQNLQPVWFLPDK